ncbi:hypothetical protein HZS55_15690 [Halosimplex rubrum]|uniref:Uncharacterized protein n=1 Tax=Halosimplex rubrum TaxID=869889 RepID=A0A7D5P6M2_9EURY|nr:hypothetical protein [Halosimplex rubrum]QLH78642.1 hypothetical protein HZS55_15690 [Halosimplex rubrum]
MIAGTLVQLEEPIDVRLDSTFADDGSLPALEVSTTQDSFDGRPVQAGTVAGTVMTNTEDVFVSHGPDDDDHRIVTEPSEATTPVATDWVADVTGTGLIAIESVQGPGKYDFPLDLFAARTGRTPERLEIDVEKLHMSWTDAGTLGDVWMRGADGGDGATIDYHQQASADEPATIGFGFTRPWNNTVMEGVVYESGYVAVYNEDMPSAFVRFVEEELLAFTDVADGTADQATLGESSDPECDRCGRETDTVDDSGYCMVCRDKVDEEGGSEDGYANLDTVTEADGGAADGE